MSASDRSQRPSDAAASSSEQKSDATGKKPTKDYDRLDLSTCLDDDDPEVQRMRLDPNWADAAAAVYDRDVLEKKRSVCELLKELRASQDATMEKIAEAEQSARWVDAIDGAVETLDRLPEYEIKAREMAKSMIKLRERLEQMESRVSAL